MRMSRLVATGVAAIAALATAGFSVSNTVEVDPAVVFDSGGAHFGTLISGNAGRNYMRTIQSDYADIRFVAEVTIGTKRSMKVQKA